MSDEVKEKVKEFALQAHQWMTLIGFPILVVLVGDMYMDFKSVVRNDIKQDTRIEYIQKEMDKNDRAIEILTNYVFRGIK